KGPAQPVTGRTAGPLRRDRSLTLPPPWSRRISQDSGHPPVHPLDQLLRRGDTGRNAELALPVAQWPVEGRMARSEACFGGGDALSGARRSCRGQLREDEGVVPGPKSAPDVAVVRALPEWPVQVGRAVADE